VDEILNQLSNGNINYLLKFSYSEQRNIINDLLANYENKKEILNQILPVFKEEDNWYDLAYEIFKLIYLDNDYDEYSFYLLDNQYIMLEDLTMYDIKNILENKKWGFEYVVNNLDSISTDVKFSQRMNVIIKFCNNNYEFFHLLLKKVMTCNQKVKDQFIISSFANKVYLDEDIIISSLYKSDDDSNRKLAISRIPAFLLFFAKQDRRIEKMIIDNFELFFYAEVSSKMKILDYFYSFLPSEILDKYSDVYKLYNTQPNIFTDKSISILMNDNFGVFLLDMLVGKKVSYVGSGTTTQVFKIDNSVLKLSLKKHDFNSEKNLFLIAPTETKVIYDNEANPILFVEIQKYLERKHNGIEMTKDDIDIFLKELDNMGYVITDPNCLEKNLENFGFLKDYHDANLGEFNSHEELPEWFKNRPIVLYDVDLVYKKDCEKKKIFKKGNF